MGARNYRSRKNSHVSEFRFARQDRILILRLILFLLLAGILIYSVYQIFSYVVDYFSAQDASSELREIYYAPEEEETPLPSPAPVQTPAPTFAPTRMPMVLPAHTRLCYLQRRMLRACRQQLLHQGFL